MICTIVEGEVHSSPQSLNEALACSRRRTRMCQDERMTQSPDDALAQFTRLDSLLCVRDHP
jgi:hypothetical protein